MRFSKFRTINDFVPITKFHSWSLWQHGNHKLFMYKSRAEMRETMRRKSLVCLTMAAVLAVSLTACSSGKTQKTGKESATTAEVGGKAPTREAGAETETKVPATTAQDELMEFSNKSKSMVIKAPAKWQSMDTGMDDMMIIGNQEGDVAMMIQRISAGQEMDEAQEQELLDKLSANMGDSLDGAAATVLEGDSISIDGLEWLRTEEFDAPISGIASRHYAAYFKSDDFYYFIRLTAIEDKYEEELENVKGYLQTLTVSKGTVTVGEANPELTDTIRWLNAVTSVYTTSAGFDVNEFGGIPMNDTGKALAAGLLEQSWGVVDKESANEVLDNLLNGNTNQEAQELFVSLQLFEFKSAEELQEVLSAEDFTQSEINYCQAVYSAVEELGGKGILGWDYCRGIYVAAWTHMAGYYTYEEAMDACMEFAEKIQSNFSSWDEFMESYLYGFQYWNEDDRTDSSSESYRRAQIYEDLKAVENSPFLLDFHMTLEKDW